MQYDSYPAETGWTLRRQSDGVALVNWPIGSITAPAMVNISYPMLALPGSYSLELEDSFGDGVRHVFVCSPFVEYIYQ